MDACIISVLLPLPRTLKAEFEAFMVVVALAAELDADAGLRNLPLSFYLQHVNQAPYISRSLA